MNKSQIEKLHNELLTCWNNRNAQGMASLFFEDGNVIGFDGSQMCGSIQIRTALEDVFASHQTADYVWKVEESQIFESANCVASSHCRDDLSRKK